MSTARTPRTPRTARTARRSLAAVAALGAAAALSACSFSASVGTSDFDGEELASTVTETLAAEYPESDVQDITCDDTPTIASGETTACHGVIDGTDMDLTVSWQDDEGNFSVDAAAV